MKTDGPLLKYFLARKGLSIGELADALGLARITMSKKINGHTEFTLCEVREIVKILSLTKENVWEIFFALKSA